MRQCLFCLREHEAAQPLTDEHVFPAALGGTLAVKEASCRACNNGLSSLEQALAEELAPLRLLLQIPNRRGSVPKTAATFVTGEATYIGHVTGDGSMVVHPSVSKERNADGSVDSVYRFLPPGQVGVLRERAKKRGQQMIETGPGEPVTAEVHIGGELDTVGSPEGLRTAAKIAYVGLAYSAGKVVALSRAFDAVRQYVTCGTPEGVARLFVNRRYLEACRHGPHQHSVTIAARLDKRQACAIVRLFGELSYLVALSDCYDGADFCNTLVLDAHRGEVNKVLLVHPTAELLQLEDVSTSQDTVWDDLWAFGSNFCSFIERSVQEKRLKELELGSAGPNTDSP